VRFPVLFLVYLQLCGWHACETSKFSLVVEDLFACSSCLSLSGLFLFVFFYSLVRYFLIDSGVDLLGILSSIKRMEI